LGHRAFEPLGLDPKDTQLVARLRQAAHLNDRALSHFVMTNTVHIKFAAAERVYPNYRLTAWISSSDEVWQGLTQSGFHLYPDGYAEFHKDGLEHRFFLELDRGTERNPILHKKLSSYHDYARSGTFTSHFAADRFRVLFITTTNRRLEHMARAIAPYNKQLFWLATVDDFLRNPLFAAYWKTNLSTNAQSLATPI
jgi:hypothetical protein